MGSPRRTSGRPEGEGEALAASPMDTDLYSMGAHFCDCHPELVEEVVGHSARIETEGMSGYAEADGVEVDEAFGMLLTGLAVRYYTAVAG